MELNELNIIDTSVLGPAHLFSLTHRPQRADGRK